MSDEQRTMSNREISNKIYEIVDKRKKIPFSRRDFCENSIFRSLFCALFAFFLLLRLPFSSDELEINRDYIIDRFKPIVSVM